MEATDRIHDAVTAVLVHDREVFVVRRHRRMAAFPGYCAFPGGKLERSDSDGRIEGGVLSEFPARLVRGLARELAEELDFNLFAALRDGLIRSIHCLGEATTPAFVPVRFRTWFFRIDLSERPEFDLDPNELEAGVWTEPARLLAQYQRGRLLAVPPTLAVLRTLARDPDARLVEELEPSFDPELIPVIEPLAGLRMMPVPSNTLPPATATNCFHIGDPGAPRLLVDPSPKDEETYARLRRTVERLGCDRVLITHAHPDHCERADRLAAEFGVPVLMSAHTAERLADRGAFRDLALRIVEDGDEVTRWHGEPVRALAAPGHDRGQLVLMAESRAWCIVGDLIQGIGTVVIAPPEGDMQDYFRTMEALIRIRPRVIIPSHGGAMGSVFRLQTALAHRQAREEAILAGLREGLDEDGLLQKLYAGTDPRLLPLARINIRGHIDKLRREGRLADPNTPDQPTDHPADLTE